MRGRAKTATGAGGGNRTLFLSLEGCMILRQAKSGLVLFWKRLEHGAFRWPPISDGMMRLTASQLAALVDGMDWSRLYARDVAQPTATS
jgi:transposase